MDRLPDADRLILSTAVLNGMGFFITGNQRDFNAFYHKRIAHTLILTRAVFLNRHWK